ncbi:MAG: DUF1491 family protein [Sphingomonadales bacterium]|nr:DUF1491 family protein [Sphingomonadales bacterium]MDE2170823.1 DUF1491 family protein [Sphingomonadales bacterium]
MSETPRLPAALEVSALVRRVNAEGGFATVVAKGEPDAGTILLILCENGRNQRVFERMPMADGTRGWHCARRLDPEEPQAFHDWLERRRSQDPDLWIVELDIAGAERFI